VILLDSCAILEILWGAEDADALAESLDVEQERGSEVVVLNPVALEASSVIAVRYKQGRLPRISNFEDDLAKVAAFQMHTVEDDLTAETIREAARIKSEYSASMVDCYLIASALRRKADVISADKEILGYKSRAAHIRKIGKRFSSIRWR